VRSCFLVIAFLCELFQTASSQVVSDSGSWNVQITGFPGPYYCISAVDRNVCWFGGASGRIIRTTNGGNSWALTNWSTVENVYFIEGSSDSIAFTRGNGEFGPSIQRTTDGGTSWPNVFWQFEGYIHEIRMQDKLRGIALGRPLGGTWMILRTTNGGASWFRIPTEPPQTGTEDFAGGFWTFDTTHIWFGSSSGRVYFTTDGGQTWAWSYAGIPQYGNYLWFNSRDLGLTAWTTGISRTTNTGITWTASLNPNVSGKTGLVGALRSTEFWLLSGGIYYTPNAADSWTMSPPHGLTKNASLIDMVTEGQNVFAWAKGIYGDTVYHYNRIVTHVDERPGQEPAEFALDQNYPNPFNPTTTIRFSLPFPSLNSAQGRAGVGSHVTLKVYDVLCREVATLVNESKAPGMYTASWDAGNVASGLYFYRLSAGSFVATRKMILMK
jgi:photosystem II stability/assembly factor-like uncharacterized protein